MRHLDANQIRSSNTCLLRKQRAHKSKSIGKELRTMGDMDWDIVEQGMAMRRVAWDMIAGTRWLELSHANDEGIEGLMGREFVFG